MSRGGAAVLAAAVLASGCGDSARPREVKARLASPPGCVVKVFFASRVVSGREATRAQIAAVRRRLAASSKVRTYAYVSKHLGFRRLKRRHPEIVFGVTAAVLPVVYEIVPRSAKDARPLAADLRHAHGVDEVRASRAC